MVDIHLFPESKMTITLAGIGIDEDQKATKQKLEDSVSQSPPETEIRDIYKRDLAELVQSLECTIALARVISQGLDRYTSLLYTSMPGTVAPQVSLYEIHRVSRVQSVIRMKCNRMQSMRDALIAYKGCKNERWTFNDGHWRMKQFIIEAYDTEKDYIERARAYLIDCHILYKKNHMLFEDDPSAQPKSPDFR